MGRTKKYTTKFLKDVISVYIEKNEGLLRFKDLADFANKSLKIDGISYYHFSRNEEINELVIKYNESLKKDILSFIDDDDFFSMIDVEALVDNNFNNKIALKKKMILIQKSQKNLFDKYIKVKLELKAINEKLENEVNKKEKYRKKYRNYKNYTEELKAIINKYEKTINLYHEQQMVSALNSSNIYELELASKVLKEDLNDDKMNDLNKVRELFPQIFE